MREPNTFTGAELEDARWFSRGEVAGAVAEDSWDSAEDGGRTLRLPPRSAIARRLIEARLEE